MTIRPQFTIEEKEENLRYLRDQGLIFDEVFTWLMADIYAERCEREVLERMYEQ